MPDIMIEVWDATGNKRQQVEVPVESEVNRVIAVLIDRMTLPRHSPDGQMMSYKFHHKASGRQLLDTQTLADAGVSDGDILRLQPEITAGSASSVVTLHDALDQCQTWERASSGPRYV
jgi:uncharacterized ubiquitin-like protein YukD